MPDKAIKQKSKTNTQTNATTHTHTACLFSWAHKEWHITAQSQKPG